MAIARWVHSALVVGEANAWLWWWYSGNTTNEGLIQQSVSVTTKRNVTEAMASGQGNPGEFQRFFEEFQGPGSEMFKRFMERFGRGGPPF